MSSESSGIHDNWNQCDVDGGVINPSGPQIHHLNDDYDDGAGMAESEIDTSIDQSRSQDEIVSSPNTSNAGHSDQACCKKVCYGIQSLWATHQTQDTENNKELKVKTTLRELVIYIIFLVVLCIVTFTMSTALTFYFTDVLKSKFTLEQAEINNPMSTYAQISNAEEWFEYAMGPLIKGLYSYNISHATTDDDRALVLMENRLIGVPRLRLLRVRNDSCMVHEDFRAVINVCYGSYSSGNEDTAPYGLMNGTAWIYQTAAELDSTSYWGILSTYGGGGYVQDLTFDGKSSLEMIQELYVNNWIERGTRAIFIDFTVYNANVNLFSIVRLVCEFPPTGGVLATSSFRTMKLIRYVSNIDYFVLSCEILFCLFIIYYIIEEILEIKYMGLAYLKSFWSWLDIVIIVFSICAISFNAYRTVTVNNVINILASQTQHFESLNSISHWQLVFNCTLGVTIFIAWLKLFKFIGFNKTMTQLSMTLGSCVKDIAGYSVMFFTIFLAFAQLGYLIFGSQLSEYATFEQAIFTQFCIILGDFNFHILEKANRVLGPTYFILFVFFSYFVLLNMFFAIIIDTYSEVKAELSRQKNEFEIADYFKRGYQKMLDKLNLRRDKAVKVQKSSKSPDARTEKRVDFSEWRNDLMRRGYAQAEIVAVFSKYDLDGCRIISESELRKVQADLDKKRYASRHRDFDDKDSLDDSDEDDDEVSTVKSSGHHMASGVSHSEFTVLQRRVDRMEHSIGSIVSKIDAVLVKLDSMEKAKARRRETVSRLLDGIAQSEGVTDESKCQHMERLVRDELERWESESCISGFDPVTGSSSVTRSNRSGQQPPIQDYSSTVNA